MPVLESWVSVRCEIEKAFDFLTQTENFSRLVPPDVQLRVVQAPERFQLGSRFEVQVLGYGIPQTVDYEITEFLPPRRFVEKQTKGPLGRYVHVHELSEQENGMVLLADRIEFEPPGGLLGFLLSADRLKSSLEQALAHRHRELKSALETQ